MTTERRQFARVAFAAGAELITTQERLTCQVIDISLKGVLLQLPAGPAPRAGMPCLVNLPLASGDEAIAMAKEVGESIEGFGIKFALGPVEKAKEQMQELNDLGLKTFSLDNSAVPDKPT